MRSNLDQIDFARLYREQKAASSFKTKSVKEWDEKAAAMNERIGKSSYFADFISKVNFEGAKTLMDFACGTGALSLGVADKFDRVLMCDYSPKMLEFAVQNGKNLGFSHIESKLIAFEDSWDELPKSDIVFASRCLEVADLQSALTKLVSKCNKRLYFTYKTGKTYLSDDVIKALNEDLVPRPDYIYPLNLLYQMGFEPTLEYISTQNVCMCINSAQELIDKVEFSFKTLNESQKMALRELYNNGGAKSEGVMKWAFIAIDVS